MEEYITLQSVKLGYDPNVKIPKTTAIYLDTDDLEAEVIYIKRNGRTLTFPIWEFWQILERIHDCEGYEFW